MSHKKNTANIDTLLTFIVWPVLGFVINFFKKPSTQKGLIFASFYALVGYFFLLIDPVFDSYRYAVDFKQASAWGINQFLEYNAESGMLDLYNIYSYALVSLITNNPHVLFAFWGFIFGFFTYKTFEFISESLTEGNTYKFVLGVLIVMLLINPYININGVRFWTATWVFLAGWFGYETQNKKLWLCIMLITPLMHTTFIFPIVVFLLSKVKFAANLKVLYFAYMVSFIIGSLINVESVANYIPFLGESSRYSTYVDMDYVNSRNEVASSRSFINTILSELPKYFILVFMTWLYTSKKMFRYAKSDIITKTLTYLLIFLCVCCILQVIPSFRRFDKISHVMVLYLVIQYRSRGCIKSPYLLPLLFFVFFGDIYNIWFIHNDLISLKYLLPFAYLF